MPAMDFPNSPINGQTTIDGRYYFDSSVGSTGAWRSTPLPVGGLPAGSIIQWSSSTLPANWLLCDGSAVSRSTYSSLFAAIGTQYGAGDGTTTFNLPDIPNGDTSGIVANVRINSQVTVTTTNTDLSGVTVNAQLRAGRTYRISFSSPNLNASAVGRARFDLLSNGALIARDYVGIPLNVGGVAFNIQTLYSPPSDGTYTFKVQGMVDFGSATTMTVYADGNSTTLLTVEDMGEASGSSLRQRPIIKASAGWTAGDSELATRLGVVETANATTNRSGLVPLIPTSVATSSGSASVDSQGNVTFTGVTAISLNGVFTSAYENYRIMIGGNWITNVSGTGTAFRLRANGSDNTSNVYYGQGVYQSGTGVPSSSQWSTGINYHYLSNLYTDGYGITMIDLFSPALPVRTHGIDVNQGLNVNTGVYSHHTTLHDAKTSYDGFTILTTSANNMTGRLRVYGYR